MSIHQYRTQLRLERALSLLLELDNMSQVALELGFSRYSHFSAAFHKAYSINSRAYLQGIRISQAEQDKLSPPYQLNLNKVNYCSHF
jgi:AraC-like DNA-binding protein